ncbi:unnamed protein product, partial [Prorocentrum cordatum]
GLGGPGSRAPRPGSPRRPPGGGRRCPPPPAPRGRLALPWTYIRGSALVSRSPPPTRPAAIQLAMGSLDSPDLGMKATDPLVTELEAEGGGVNPGPPAVARRALRGPRPRAALAAAAGCAALLAAVAAAARQQPGDRWRRPALGLGRHVALAEADGVAADGVVEVRQLAGSTTDGVKKASTGGDEAKKASSGGEEDCDEVAAGSVCFERVAWVPGRDCLSLGLAGNRRSLPDVASGWFWKTICHDVLADPAAGDTQWGISGSKLILFETMQPNCLSVFTALGEVGHAGLSVTQVGLWALLSLALAGMQLEVDWALADEYLKVDGDTELANLKADDEATRRAAEKQGGFRAPPSCSGKAAAMHTEEWRQRGAGERGGTQHLGHDVFKKHPELTWVGEPHAQCFLDMLGTGAGLPSQYLAAGTKTQIINPFGRCCNGQIPPNMRFIHITQLNAIAWGLSKLPQELARNKSLQDLESQGYPMMHASYEELMADEPRLVARITRFLGVSPFTQKGHATVNSAKKELRDSFANWPEVVAAFCGTRFERDLGLRSGETCVHKAFDASFQPLAAAPRRHRALQMAWAGHPLIREVAEVLRQGAEGADDDGQAEVELRCPEVHIPPIHVECLSEGPGVIGHLAYLLAGLLSRLSWKVIYRTLLRSSWR